MTFSGSVDNRTAVQDVEPLDVARVRRDFPILETQINGKPLVYLDNAATTQKPQAVIDALVHYYLSENSNVHRGVHTLSQRATDSYEAAREAVRRFINAREPREIVFVRGTTEAINLVAGSWARANIGKGDEIVISGLEHHSNIVPWQLLCEATGARLRVIPINDSGELMMDEYERLLNRRTRLVSVTHVANSLGTVNPVAEITRLAHTHGAYVLIDGAQAAPHQPVDVQKIDCDFYAFSGHKLYGPTGIGALYAKSEILKEMPPYQGGGEMIASVTFEKTLYADPPARFEAGTPHIAGAVGMGAAIQYVSSVGIEKIAAHEQSLLQYGTERLGSIDRLKILGTAAEKAGVISFTIEGVHPHDVGTILDSQGIAIRTGHHCAQPVMTRFGIPATARASFGLYNTRDEIDALYDGVQQVFEVFG